MHVHLLTTAEALSDQELFTRIPVLAASEREAATELIAHLAVLDTRPALRFRSAERLLPLLPLAVDRNPV